MTSIPLGKTVMAMCAGVATVSAGTAAVKTFEESEAPSFRKSFKGEARFDQSTFLGRYKQMFLACDPLLLLHSDQEIKDAADEISQVKKEFEENPELEKSSEENERLWRLKRLVDVSMPNQEEGVVPAPFRMSGFVPFNGPICVAMVASASTAGLLFWSWANQSQNALVNYFNRNADSEMDTQTFLTSYGSAVSSALSVGFVLSVGIQKRFSPEKAKQLLKFVAFPSSLLASCLNCFIVRYPEIGAGVPLLDPHDLTPVFSSDQTSVEAARKGVYETVASRAILQVPVYFIPPFLTSTLFRSTLASNPTLTVPLTTFLLLVSFGFGLPFAIAVFPQYGTIDRSQVESNFQQATDKSGQPIEVFKYNKGL